MHLTSYFLCFLTHVDVMLDLQHQHNPVLVMKVMKMQVHSMTQAFINLMMATCHLITLVLTPLMRHLVIFESDDAAQQHGDWGYHDWQK
jgi:hypothetical protein